MSLFDKLKQGVNDAGQKAKAAVELNRLKAQIQALQKQIEEKQAVIGGIVYNQYEQTGQSAPFPAIESICHEIASLHGEIKQLDGKLKEMNNEKECTCGKIVALDTRFCPFCGYEFAKQPEIIEVTLQKQPAAEQASEQPQTDVRGKTQAEGNEPHV